MNTKRWMNRWLPINLSKGHLLFIKQHQNNHFTFFSNCLVFFFLSANRICHRIFETCPNYRMHDHFFPPDVQVTAWSIHITQGNSTETFPACSSLLTTRTTTEKVAVTALRLMLVVGGSIPVMRATLTGHGRTVSGAGRGTLPSPREGMSMEL